MSEGKQCPYCIMRDSHEITNPETGAYESVTCTYCTDGFERLYHQAIVAPAKETFKKAMDAAIKEIEKHDKVRTTRR